MLLFPAELGLLGNRAHLAQHGWHMMQVSLRPLLKQLVMILGAGDETGHHGVFALWLPKVDRRRLHEVLASLAPSSGRFEGRRTRDIVYAPLNRIDRGVEIDELVLLTLHYANG